MEFQIERSLGAPDSASFDLIYRGGTRPEPGDEVIFAWQGTRRFGGLIQSVSESEIKGRFDASVITVKATGYRSYTDRVVVANKYSPGGTPFVIIYDIWKHYIQQFGVTFVYEGGPTEEMGEQIFHYVTATEAINRIVDQAPGWNWWIDHYKQLHFKQTQGASVDAPFSLTNASLNVDSITVTKSNARFRNRQWVLPSGDVAGLQTDTFTADGSTQSYDTPIIWRGAQAWTQN